MTEDGAFLRGWTATAPRIVANSKTYAEAYLTAATMMLLADLLRDLPPGFSAGMVAAALAGLGT